jgi:hypothetical protein
MRTNDMPLILRLAGLWLMWTAWCTIAGWTLSAFGCLDGWGHALVLPVLLFSWWQWLKATAPATPAFGGSRLPRVRAWMFRPLPLIYAGIVVLSFISGCLYQPWSFDAVTYRLPRLLYWWAAHHWYWIGTLDHRLDFSSCGFEWQMLPVIELTHSDRLLFLLNWIPFLLMPWQTFFVFKSLGVNGRSARRWMWLLPAGYCFALQSSGLQNDGYSINYLLAAIGFAVVGFRSRRMGCVWMTLLAAGLLTGGKVSNLPLLLPLGVVLLPAIRRVNLFNWKTLAVVFLAAVCSFIPIALISLAYTGDWTGDPTDQWNTHTHGKLGGLLANILIFFNDVAQPPVFPITSKIAPALAALNHSLSPLMDWLRRCHHEGGKISIGDMAYEGQAGLGFSAGGYLVFVILGCRFIKKTFRLAADHSLPVAWRLTPWLAWIGCTVLFMEIGLSATARYAAPYYPLILISILRLPRIAAFERHKIAAVYAGLAMLSVVPVILFTPARPFVPECLLSRMERKSSLQTIAAKYRLWAGLRDDLAPIRNALPPGTTRLGYAGAFRETPYGLWKPLGRRVVVELGLPPGSRATPPGDLDYAVVTENGIKQRYDMDLKPWCEWAGAEIVFEMKRNNALLGAVPKYDSWYLVRFRR